MFHSETVRKHNNLVERLALVPSSENEQMGTDGRAAVTLPARRRTSLLDPLLPTHGFRVEHQKLIVVSLRLQVLESTIAAVDVPSDKHYDVSSRQIDGVAEARGRRSAAHPKTGPSQQSCVQDPQIVELARAETSAHGAQITANLFFVLAKPSLDNQVVSDE